MEPVRDSTGERETLDWRGLVGLSQTMTDLGKLMDSGRMHPVLMIEGREGLGKRHLAIWLAARWLCSAAGAGKPCGQCGSCREMLTGLHPDVMVLDQHGDSIKTAHVESLQSHFNMLSSGGVRVGIIMNADRMTLEACNRALKTLEEPTDQARVILTTSRPLAMPATILGRCLRWRVALPPRDEVLGWAQKVLSQEGRAPATPEQLRTWAARLGFSPGRMFRDIQNTGEHEGGLAREVQSLLRAAKPTEVTRAAAELARVYKAKTPEILQVVEWELSAAYRDWFLAGRSSEITREKLHSQLERRRLLRDIRKQAVMGKVVLNAQLVAESIGLARWNEGAK